MADQVQQNVAPQVEQKPTDKELNFRALEQKYQRALEQERAAREQAERLAKEALEKKQVHAHDDDEDDSEPYIDRKKLKKEQEKLGKQLKQETQSEIQKAVHMAIAQERQQNWIKQNSDFEEVMQHAEKLYHADPELAQTILEMPEGFERQKLVYKTIKTMGIHKEKPKEKTIQEKVDENRKSPYYQPSSVGTAPYSQVGDFSAAGQKNAYDKMMQLKKQLRLV